MKCNKQFKYSNYVTFSHFHRTTVNNSGLDCISSKCMKIYKTRKENDIQRFIKYVDTESSKQNISAIIMDNWAIM